VGGWLCWTQWEWIVGVGVDVSANVWVNWMMAWTYFLLGFSGAVGISIAIIERNTLENREERVIHDLSHSLIPFLTLSPKHVTN
jgi:hypothetical protein